jgi:hypothetical protein
LKLQTMGRTHSGESSPWLTLFWLSVTLTAMVRRDTL